MTNLASKDILARLLATENVTVQHANVSTASFHVRDRILTLPTWEDMQNFTYDHLVGHEVGHALFTPEKGWHDAVVDGGPVMRSFLNVVEDARIEKLIQRRYPGLRRSFVKSYRKMLADGFFGINESQINNMNLIDRINVYFKCGASVGVEFSTEELPWLDEISSAETWEEVEDISRRLLEFCREKYEEQKQEQQKQEQQDDEGEEDEGEEDEESIQDSIDSDNEEFDYAEDYDSDEDDDAEDDAQDEESTSQKQGGDSFDDSMKSQTEEELHKNIEEELSQSGFDSTFNYNIPEVDPKKFVVDYKNTIALMEKAEQDFPKLLECDNDRNPRIMRERLYQEFYSENKRIVDHMVKEFEMKKKAAEYVRATTSKTGVIDTVKMNNYLFEDDIFRKVTVVPEGKNHGILIYLDWSGSMLSEVYAAVQQMILISMFCRKANIPFRVFIFTNEEIENDIDSYACGDLVPSVCLREIFSDRMRKSEFRRVCSAMLLYGYRYKNYYSNNCYVVIPQELSLCGTPLDDALVVASSVHDEFKKQYRLDVVSTFVITDGSSNELKLKSEYGSYFPVNPNRKILVRIVDKKTKKQYRVKRRMTEVLIQIYKDRTGSKTIGYFIAHSGKGGYRNACYQFSPVFLPSKFLDDNSRKYMKQGYSVCPHASYDEFFVISKKQMLVTSNPIEIAEGASKAKIRAAFKKSQGNKKNTRAMVSEVLDLVS